MTETNLNNQNRLYSWIWIYLLGLTGIELLLAYKRVFTPEMMMLVLMLLSVVKAGMIMNWFMHLGSERIALGMGPGQLTVAGQF